MESERDLESSSEGYASDSCDSLDEEVCMPPERYPQAPAPSTLTTHKTDRPIADGLSRLKLGLSKTPELSLTEGQALSCVAVSLWSRLSDNLRSGLDAEDISRWLLSADMALAAASWQCESVLSVSSLVVLNMVAARLMDDNQRLAEACFGFRSRSLSDFKALVLVSLYVTCMYTGQEITYPSWPFLSMDEDMFWRVSVRAALALSKDLLRIHSDCDVYGAELQRLAKYMHRLPLQCRATQRKAPVRLSVAELLLEEFVESVTS